MTDNQFFKQYTNLFTSAIALTSFLYYFVLATVSYQGSLHKTYETNFFIVGALSLNAFIFGIGYFVLETINLQFFYKEHRNTKEFYRIKYISSIFHTLFLLAAFIVTLLCSDDSCVVEINDTALFLMSLLLFLSFIFSLISLSYSFNDFKYVVPKITYKFNQN